MSTASRIAASSPRPAARASVARLRGPASRASAPTRSRRRALASALCGTLAGVAAGAVFVAVAPVVGRTVVADRASTIAPGGTNSVHGAATAPVSAVLAPAIAVGVVAAPDPEAAWP
jgi:hypothetical protein